MPINNCSLVITNIADNSNRIQTVSNLSNFENTAAKYDDSSAEEYFRLGWYYASANKKFENVTTIYGIELNIGYYAEYPSDKEINVTINGVNVHNISRTDVESACGRNKNCMLTVMFDNPVTINSNANKTGGTAIVQLFSQYGVVNHYKLGVDKNTVLNLSSNVKQGIIGGEYIVRLITGSDIIKFKQQLSRGEYTWYGECYNQQNAYKKTPFDKINNIGNKITYKLSVINSIPTYPKKLLPESGSFSNNIDIQCGESYDGDNDALTYSIWYIRADLRNSEWQLIEQNGDGNATLDISTMPNNAMLRLKCLANDGLSNSPTKESSWLKVQK